MSLTHDPCLGWNTIREAVVEFMEEIRDERMALEYSEMIALRFAQFKTAFIEAFQKVDEKLDA